MAARTGLMLQYQNLNVHFYGVGGMGKVTLAKQVFESLESRMADSTGQRKARAGGRKPLGDILFNAGKPINQFDGKKALDGSLITGKPSVGQAPESDKRIVGKSSEKSRSGSRKELSDISNSPKPHVPDIKVRKTLKLSSLTEEPLNPSAIAEEQILHDHKKCIQSQFETADVHQFFKTVGLEDDDHMRISSELSAISKLKKPDNAYMELKEVPEQLPEVQSLSALCGSPTHCKTPSPTHCKTPSLSSYPSMWNDSIVNFRLIESPKFSKN